MKILLGAIYPFIYILLFFAIPFDNYVRVLPNILMILLAVSFPFVVTKSDFLKIKKTPTLIFVIFCFTLIFISLIAGRIESDFVVIKKVMLAVAFAILYIPVRDFRKIKLTIILSSLSVITFSVIKILLIIYDSEDIVLGYSREVVEGLLMDRLYIGLLCILSILVSYQSLKPKYHPNNLYHLINIIVNLLFVFLMVSKVAILILVFLVFLNQMYSSKRAVRIIGASLLFGSILLLGSMFYLNQSKEDPSTSKSFLRNTLTWEMRTTVWDNTSFLIRTSPLLWTGYGVEESKDKLVEIYKERILDTQKRNRFVNNRFNSHNQFVDFYLSFGIIAALFFIVLIVMLFHYNKKMYLPTAFVLVLVCYCLVENVFYRQIGAYYVGFVLTAILIHNSFTINKRDNDIR